MWKTRRLEMEIEVAECRQTAHRIQLRYASGAEGRNKETMLVMTASKFMKRREVTEMDVFLIYAMTFFEHHCLDTSQFGER